MTGTVLAPFEYLSISCSFAISDLTSTYSALLPYASRAFAVYGQPALPKMMTLFPIPDLLSSSIKRTSFKYGKNIYRKVAKNAKET